ncbi:Anaphase-promoting complex subunit, partial [Thalictrum thalictroides]
LDDAVEERVNVIVHNGQMFRCALRRSPSSSLTNDCITAMAEGLHSTFYNHLLVLLWEDGNSGYLAKADSGVDSEWEAFNNIKMHICGKSSIFHKRYRMATSVTGIPGAPALTLQMFDCSSSNIEDKDTADKSFYSQLLLETLDSLHPLYENLKLDNLRKR